MTHVDTEHWAGVMRGCSVQGSKPVSLHAWKCTRWPHNIMYTDTEPKRDSTSSKHLILLDTTPIVSMHFYGGYCKHGTLGTCYLYMGWGSCCWRIKTLGLSELWRNEVPGEDESTRAAPHLRRPLDPPAQGGQRADQCGLRPLHRGAGAGAGWEAFPGWFLLWHLKGTAIFCYLLI